MLVQGTSNKENIPKKGNDPTMPVSSNVLGSIFSSVSNCTINISPQNFTVNVCSNPQQPTPDIDVKALFEGIDMETFLS